MSFSIAAARSPLLKKPKKFCVSLKRIAVSNQVATGKCGITIKGLGSMQPLEQDIDTHLYRAVSVTRLSLHISILLLAPLAAATLKYRAGQYVNIELPDGTQRSYSPATQLRTDGYLELHVRVFPNGKFSQLVKQGVEALSVLKVRGPFGSCVWEYSMDETGPAIFLATGTGIAPIRALIQEALACEKARELWLYWGGHVKEDLYLSQEFVEFEGRFPHFHFVPVVSIEGNTAQAASRHVHRVASLQHKSLAQACVYACGCPDMVNAAGALLYEKNALRMSRYYTDPFIASTTVQSWPNCTSSKDLGAKITVRVARPGTAVPEELRIFPDGTLMTALRSAHLIDGVCGGQQSCGTCRLTLNKTWFEALPKPARSEARLLSTLLNSGPLDRLACQIFLNPGLDGMQVFTP
ncbi:FAD-binding oxidoreductase [Pseudomonas sp. 10B1]|uniref:FAD-binding oxidoreductase n=1 Tax=unclassified Pseudomonas TaxID=196821 RepID=UPI002AB3C9C7|nr:MULTISPECIES: FAD-binding oxidoreductase [unclassified Pseudomonas]MDY7562386.1 FAD-binding oxidoreductase [Pseudomonas sp. AB6]MEA9994689.1 FAD-binding oxidoreductase [Pseudomonas sp. AA4]MEB0086352.1 FAD-binding oxidoreductase [Pseudomonas sp. RTI1]MEB0126449.1 FAD-binding oxidoreductase [Pseudomonas sp. CCC1.2]MEB0154789.1 FAD-binding oxidoreductase [Pseudomonas sp. CCC4.3]